jgi:hypothetical protein
MCGEEFDGNMNETLVEAWAQTAARHNPGARLFRVEKELRTWAG